ncbi:hypothetical protein CANARDRAFT_29766 [[Candida] arabinofermentans NRRL YB-2248]|uniref:Uncharacterized protein n=1 Tax=[Candida] arabinofermentans NRRL YB-2248 TaxID=983967 RepID=A0A1E4SWB9_9ASCO|nr:hypothetical protein CANARDRAFT_29766 [[Candida] arabinofermentans NRRL YB-2248]
MRGQLKNNSRRRRKRAKLTQKPASYYILHTVTVIKYDRYESGSKSGRIRASIV